MSQPVRDAGHNAGRYFQWLADQSKLAPPPGSNAANGWFREAIVHENGAPADQPIDAADAPAQAIQAAYRHFRSNFRDNVDRDGGNVQSGAFGNLPGFVEAVRAYSEQIVAVLSAIFVGQDDGRAARIAKAAAEAEESSKTIGFKVDGTHMNGWVSHMARDRANEARPMLQPALDSGDADAQRIGRVLYDGFGQIAQLRTEGHNPWLRAEWQLGFQVVGEAIAIGTE